MYIYIISVSLNPCFNGTYSRSIIITDVYTTKYSLNPCFNGTYSRRHTDIINCANSTNVLILVLMEHTLGDFENMSVDEILSVLILVLMEHTLGAKLPLV